MPCMISGLRSWIGAVVGTPSPIGPDSKVIGDAVALVVLRRRLDQRRQAAPARRRPTRRRAGSTESRARIERQRSDSADQQLDILAQRIVRLDLAQHLLGDHGDGRRAASPARAPPRPPARPAPTCAAPGRARACAAEQRVAHLARFLGQPPAVERDQQGREREAGPHAGLVDVGQVGRRCRSRAAADAARPAGRC